MSKPDFQNSFVKLKTLTSSTMIRYLQLIRIGHNENEDPTRTELKNTIDWMYDDMRPTYGHICLIRSNLEKNSTTDTWFALKTMGFLIGKIQQFPTMVMKGKANPKIKAKMRTLERKHDLIKSKLIDHTGYQHVNVISYALYNCCSQDYKIDIREQLMDLTDDCESEWNDIIFEEYELFKKSMRKLIHCNEKICVVVKRTSMTGKKYNN